MTFARFTHTSPATQSAMPRLTGRLVAAVRHLRDYPLAGRVVPELGRATIREVVHGAYRIVYRFTPSAVEILAVIHGAREFPPPSLEESK